MSISVGYSTPMLHAADIERSIRFYELLGFKTVDTDGCSPLGWARLHCEGGALMFLRAEHPLHPAAQSIMLYMYSPDLAGLREHLLSHGIQVPPIKFPEYMPSGEVMISDPDGYLISIAHWGAQQQQAWEKRIAARP